MNAPCSTHCVCSASDAALVISAGGGDRAQLILSQSGAIEWILGQLGDGTLIEQNFQMGMFERNVLIVYPDGTYQLALSWDQPLKANTEDYLWFYNGQLYLKTGSRPTGPDDGIGGASGAPEIIPPDGFLFLVDRAGAYLTDSDGAYLVEAA